MEAPDKIYLERDYPDNGVLPVGLHYNPSQSDVQYIRKDLLLRWLEAKVYEHNEDKFDDGFNTAIGQVIDKINSL